MDSAPAPLTDAASPGSVRRRRRRRRRRSLQYPVNLSLSARSGQDDEDEESEELEGDDDNFGTDEDQHENKVGNDALFSTEAGLVNESAKHRVPSELQGFFEMSMQPA